MHGVEYKRQGTQTLIANFEVATGKVISPTLSDTRTREDFVAHIRAAVSTDPDAKWVFVADQLIRINQPRWWPVWRSFAA